MHICKVQKYRFGPSRILPKLHHDKLCGIHCCSGGQLFFFFHLLDCIYSFHLPEGLLPKFLGCIFELYTMFFEQTP